jgi:hypothetical protein
MNFMNKLLRLLTCSLLLLSVANSRAADTLVATGSVWKYLDTGGDQGTVWREPAFDDTAWPAGPAQLGFGDGDEATLLANLASRRTYYFRQAFNVANPSLYGSLTVFLLRDDGGIVYINGVEVFRSNMPLTNVTFNSFANINQNTTNETIFFPRTVPASVLVPGINQLAVEIHQASAGSNDLSFDLALFGNAPLPNQAPTANPQNVLVTQNTPRSITLTGSDPEGSPLTFSIVGGPTSGTLTGTPPNLIYIPAPGFVGGASFTFKVNDGSLDSAPATVNLNVNPPPPPPSQTLVLTNANWRYLDTGVDPGTAWRGLGYNDSAWASGFAELGFGDGGERTVINSMPNGSPLITAYFRRSFVVSNANQIASLALRLFRDDGGIVYINGVEVFRSNMPGGSNVNYFTLASTATPDDGNSPFSATVPSSMLVNGSNVVAVEVHQNAATSSDMSFNFDLRGNIGVVTNHPPSAPPQSVSVDEDASVAITLQGSDPDNNLLFYTFSQPAHGIVSGTAPNLTYQPDADYNGTDSFTYIVSDGRGGSALGVISITVNPVNDAPVAVAKVAAADDPSNQTRHLVIVTANNTDAAVILDGTASSDVDGDTLSYAWFLNDSLTPFSTAATVTQTLPIGNHAITLVVSDGVTTSSDIITVQIFTPCTVVENLATLVEAAALAPNERNSLLGHLNAACATFGNGNTSAGVAQLELFQTRVDNKIAPNDPALAAVLNAAALDIINAVQ